MTTQTKTEKRILKFKVPIIVEWDEINFHSYSPALKGLHMDGETEQEALENARLTAAEFIRIMIEEGIPIPLTIITGQYKKKTGVKGYYEEEIAVTIP